MKRNAALFLDLRHAIEEYPLSRRKIQQLIKDQRLPAFRLDGKIILRREDIEELLTKQPISAPSSSMTEAHAG
jgi:Helix-turn-helix domain